MELNVDDPKAYTKLWSIQLSQSIILNTELLDYIYLENEKDAVHLVKLVPEDLSYSVNAVENRLADVLL
jgi:hypothetical protein